MKDSPIIVGIFTIVGTITGIVIASILSTKAAKRQEFNKAAKAFRKTLHRVGPW